MTSGEAPPDLKSGLVISMFLVSGTKISPTMNVMAAITIGYQSPA
jgi:hypothetical protein